MSGHKKDYHFLFWFLIQEGSLTALREHNPLVNLRTIISNNENRQLKIMKRLIKECDFVKTT